MSYSKTSALLEAIIYLATEPVTVAEIQKAIPDVSRSEIEESLHALVERFQSDDHGVEVRQIAEGYRFSTKPEFHDTLRTFLKSQIPPTRLSLAALETLAVIAYKQPITVPEIQDIRGVNASGVIRTLLDKKLVVPAGRKDVLGRPILYKTTKDFLMHFGLNTLEDLPSVEEFEAIIKAHAPDQADLPLDAPAEDNL